MHKTGLYAHKHRDYVYFSQGLVIILMLLFSLDLCNH